MRVEGNAPDPLTLISAVEDDGNLAAGIHDARQYLRTSTTDEVDQIRRVFIPAAVNRFEAITGRAVLRRQMVDTLEWPGMLPRYWSVPLPPLVTVDEVVSIDRDGGETIVTPAMYRTDDAREPARLMVNRRDEWPAGRETLRIKWTCGCQPAAVPADYVSSCLLLMALYYEQRDMVVDQGGGIGSGAAEIPGQIRDVLDEQSILRRPWQ